MQSLGWHSAAQHLLQHTFLKLFKLWFVSQIIHDPGDCEGISLHCTEIVLHRYVDSTQWKGGTEGRNCNFFIVHLIKVTCSVSNILTYSECIKKELTSVSKLDPFMLCCFAF